MKPRIIVAFILAVAVAGTMTLNALWNPASAPAQAGACYVMPHHDKTPDWMNYSSGCHQPVPVQVKRCVAGIGSSTLLGFLGLPIGPVAGFLGGAVGCASQYIH